MTTFCPNCHQWSHLPADLGSAQGNSPALPKCEHCGAALPVEGRYGLCIDCGRIHRTDYEVCPFKVEGVPIKAQRSEVAATPYTIEAQKRRPKKRADDYYWQLYFDYRDRAEESADAPVPIAETIDDEPPHPADIGGYEPVGGNGNGRSGGYSNGNGTGRNGSYGSRNISQQNSMPGSNDNSKGNGNGNGNGKSYGNNGNGYGGYGNGNGKKPGAPQSTRVDLTLTENVSLTLFPEIEEAATSVEDAAPIKVSAGNYNEFEYELINDPSRLAEVAELLASEKAVGLDTETTGLDPFTSELLLLQVSTVDKVYIVDCRRVVPLSLKPLLENPDIIKIAQNAKFEYVMLRQQAGITVNNFFDTMLAEKLLMAGIGREVSLKAIAQKYIGATLDKSVRESFYKLTMHGDAYLADEQLHYAARDAFIMIPIWRQMLPELKKHKLMQVAELEFRCVPAVGDLELAGVQIDVERWRKIIADVGVQRDAAAAELSDLLAPATMQATMFGVPSINLNSGSQLMEAFANLGVNLPDTMEATLVKFDHPAVAKLLEYRSHEKTLSAFGENVLGLINPRTGRIHPSFQQYGADTGRFSCTKPNVQQIPATSDFRKCFVAAPGYKLVTCDYSQCIAKDTWVSTISGWVRIQDHPDAISKGISPTVTLTTSRRYSVECTPDHRILTNDGWRQASDLRPGDWIALGGADTAESEPFDARAWLMGFWVGDGSLHSSPGSLYFAKGVESGVEELAAYIEETLAEKPRETEYSLYVANQRPTADLYRALFNKKDLRLPLDRIEHLGSFLSGLFDADGTPGKFGVSLSTRFMGLARDVQIALLRYGIVSNIVSGKEGFNYVPSGKLRYELRVSDSVSLANFDRFIGFRLSAKRAVFQAYSLREKRDQSNILPIPVAVMRALGVDRVQYIKNHEQNRPYTRHKLADLHLKGLEEYTRYHWDQVVSIEESGRAVEVFDLMDQPEERFIASGVVVHNCELRVLAELSGDPAFVDAFKSGQDLHTLTASQMFGVPVDQVQKPQRNAAKAINFGLAYGMGPGGLAPRLGVQLDEAKALISKYFAAYPGIQRWLDKAAKDAVRLGYSVTPLGRKRFYNLPDESLKRTNEDEWRKQIASIERQGKNSPIQGCVAGNTRIFEETHGYVPIQSLRGQVVSVWDGSGFSQAVVVYSGKKQLVKIHLWDGNYIECSPDHRFLIRPTTGTDMWKTPDQFKAQNRLMLGNAIPDWSLDLVMPERKLSPVWNAKNTTLRHITDPSALGEWLGRLASDGSMHSGAVCLLVAEHEEVLLPRLREISSQLGHVGYSVRSTLEKPKRFHRLNISSRSLVQELKALGIKERVPDCAWQNGHVLAGYLRGMFDGDGTVNTDGAFLVFGQGSKHLAWAREIQQALLLFGIRSRVNVCADRVNVRIVKKDMPIFSARIGFMNPEKQAKADAVSTRVNDMTYGRGVRVKSVEFTDEWVDMYDVVNSETERFMANGLVVHNCNADMTKLALINLRAALRPYDARTVNTVHDEIVVEARADQAEEVKRIVEEAMLGAGQAILKEVPILADAAIADYWSK